jgi:hypothetical protein
MRRLLGSALIAMMAAYCWVDAAADDAAPQQRNQRFEVEWKTPPTTYLRYNVTHQEQIDAKHPIADGVVNEEPKLGHAHFFGYEFDDSGALDPIHVPFTPEDVLIQLAMQIPSKKCATGFEWERTWNFDRLYQLPGLKLQSRYVIGATENPGGAECLVITGEHRLVAPDKEPEDEAVRWYEFSADTVARFNIEAGRLQAADVTLHAARWRAETSNVAAARVEWHWGARYDFAADFDSMAGRYLNDRVSTAIAKGADYLGKLQNADKAWPHGKHVRGGTALALLTLLTCDVPADDEGIVAGFEALKGMELEDTYSVSVSLMAYEARYITEAERRAYLSDPDKFPEFKREVSPEDGAEMQRLVDWLAEHQNTDNPFWNYTEVPETQRFDFSNTQYALLGLASALRCKIRIPSGIIGRLVEEVVNYQQPEGPKVKRIVGFKPPKDNSRKGRSTMATKPGKARGWAYASKAKWDKYTEECTSYGSMTTAGLTCLLAGIDIVDQMDAGQLKREFGNHAAIQKWKKAAEASLEDGMCWLEHWFSVTRNPNKGRYWYLYYLYGLERVMMLSHTHHLGPHDWYAQGASVLVCSQNDNGSWGNLPDTCFALLFLKKGTVPSRSVTTGKK